MLKVRVASRNLSIEWEHVATTPNINGGTSCLIYDEDQPIYGDPVVVGESFLHPNDRFDKEIGRKVSLAKALGKLFPGDSGFVSRKTVWEAYFARKGKAEVPHAERKLHYAKCRTYITEPEPGDPQSLGYVDIEAPGWTPWAQLAEIEDSCKCGRCY